MKKYHTRLIKRCLLVGGLAITILVLLLVIGVSRTRSSLLQKDADINAIASEINSQLAGQLQPATIEPGVSGEGTALLNRYDILLDKLNELDSTSASFREKVFNRSLAVELDATASLIQEDSKATYSALTALSEELNASLKFIQYSPREDFLHMGEDKADDDARIEQARIGFATTSSNLPDGATVPQSAIKDAQAALESFTATKDLVSFNTALVAAQQKIINDLQQRHQEAAQSYNQAYNDFLYQ